MPKKPGLRLEYLDPRELKANPENWRQHPEGQRQALEAVIQKVGWAGALLYNERTGRLIDGHLRKEMQTNGGKVPVLIGSWSEDNERLILASLDPIAGMAEADKERLAGLLNGLSAEEAAIEGLLGRLRAENAIQAACGDPVADPGAEVDKADELLAKWKVKAGQIWQVGRHRVMCGDSTNESNVSTLLNAVSATLTVTDPPYGVNYDPGWRQRAFTAGQLAHSVRRLGTITNDDRVNWIPAFRLTPSCVIYCWHAGIHTASIQMMLEAVGFEVRSQIIWRKIRFPIGRGNYHWRHEPCWYAVRKGQKAYWIGDRSQSTVWDIDQLGKDRENLTHSAQKPLECMARPIRNHEGNVYDPFLGTGTTMVACEQLGRSGYGMEIEPKYVAVTLERLSGMGLKAKTVG